MKRIIAILSISLLMLGGCTTKQVAEAPINTVEETTIKETTVRETTTEKAIIETTMVEETTVAKETISDEIKTLMDKYNGKSYSEVEAIDGWLDDIHNIENQGYVFICYDKKYNIMDKESATKLAESVYEKDITGNGFGGMTTITLDFVDGIAKKYKNKQSEAKAEAFSSEVSSHIKSGSGVATVINDLNPYGYTTNNLGYVVQNEQAVAHMKSLKGNDHTLYYKTEIEVFKKNNAGKVTVRSDVGISYCDTQGTFNGNGQIMWICREPNFMTTDALGQTMYAQCNNGYEEFREYCGGTTIAFKGWNDKIYNENNQKEWCDSQNLLDNNLGQFIDCTFEWIGGVGERKFRKVN